MSTSQENQQTVERVFDWIDTVLVNDVRPNTQAARAALRDLVAQAAKADELRRIVLSASLVGVVCPECGTDDDTYWRGGFTEFWECPCEGVIFTPDHPALARLDGAR